MCVDFFNADSRGIICQITSMPNSQVNYLFTLKGAKHGKHYQKNKEIFYVISGKLQICAYSVNGATRKEEYIFEAGDLFVVEPYTIHNFTFMEDTQIVAVYDIGVKNGSGTDIYTED